MVLKAHTFPGFVVIFKTVYNVSIDKLVKNGFRKYYWWSAKKVNFRYLTLFAICK